MNIFKVLQNRLQRSSQHFQVALQSTHITPRHLVRLWRCGWALYRAGPTAARPVFLHIEPTGRCNLKCVMCPRGDNMNRPMGGYMSMDLFEKICREVDPVFVAFVGFGEPLLHPEIVRMVRFCVAQGRNTRISTNAMLVDETMSRDLIRAGLHQIWFSMDSPIKEDLEAIRQGADFDRIVGNIKTFLKVRDQERSRAAATINVTLIKDNAAQAAAMVEFAHRELGIKPTFARGYGYDIQTRQDKTLRHSPDVLEHLETAAETARRLGLDDVILNLTTIIADIKDPLDGRGPCYFPYYVTAVSWDGKITPCCLFYDYQMDLGNASRGHFNESWNGPGYQDFRRNIENRRQELPICQTCPLSDVSMHNILYQLSRVPGMQYLSRRAYHKIER